MKVSSLDILQTYRVKSAVMFCVCTKSFNNTSFLILSYYQNIHKLQSLLWHSPHQIIMFSHFLVHRQWAWFPLMCCCGNIYQLSTIICYLFHVGIVCWKCIMKVLMPTHPSPDAHPLSVHIRHIISEKPEKRLFVLHNTIPFTETCSFPLRLFT